MLQPRMGTALLAVLLVPATAAYLEVLVRFREKLHPPLENLFPKEIGRFDEKLGWSLRPSAVGFSSRTGRPIEYRINSKGLRDAETSYRKPAGTFRIVLVGTSKAFGAGVPLSRHYSTLLEGLFKNVEVINLSVGGFGVDQQLLFLREEGFRYEPDMVLLYAACDACHMHDFIWGKAKPRFILADEKLTLKNFPVAHPQAEVSRLQRPRRWLQEHSHAFRLWASRVDSQDDPANLDMDAATASLRNAIIREMRDESSRQGAKFAAFAHVGILCLPIMKNGIPCLPISRTLALPGGLDHVSEEGNLIVAHELAAFLKKEAFVPQGHWR